MRWLGELDRGRRLAFALWLLFPLGSAAAAQAELPPATSSARATPDRAQDKQAAAQVGPRADIARFRARVEATLAEAGADKGYWGVLVVDARTSEVLFALNSQRYFIPASNTKLFTTALAMATLGPDYRFRTTIETRGTVNRNGRLCGDLILVGRGDPNLSNRKFPLAKEVERDGWPEKVLAELVDVVVARGIRRVEGNVVADDSYFVYERYPTGWAIDDMLWRDGAAVSALAINDNTLFLELRPGGRDRAPAWISVEPRAEYYRIQNDVITGPPGSEQKLKVSREPGSRLIVLSGTIPLKAEPHTLALAVEEPAEHAAHLLKRLLEARGVRVRGEARARHAPETSTGAVAVLAEHTSLPLIEAVRVINKVSQNLHAELLLRAAAREKTGASDTEGALKSLQDFLKGIGIEEGDVILFDGSGLSRRNLVTPQAVVKLLAYVSQQPWAEAFRSTLPIAGEDGTLSDRMNGTPAADRIWAKTGSLDHVRSLGGYAATLHGAQVIFSIFGNNHNLRGKAATGVVDAICVAMIEELGAAPEEKTKP